jgi:hypothetical protein
MCAEFVAVLRPPLGDVTNDNVQTADGRSLAAHKKTKRCVRDKAVENYSKSRRKGGKAFAVTLTLESIYERVREDFLCNFTDIETYCVCIERHKNSISEGTGVRNYHLHAYIRLEICVLLEEVKAVLREVCTGTVNVQPCRSERNWLKYITKEVPCSKTPIRTMLLPATWANTTLPI